ncbi:MAG: aldose 1-epimerase family protein [Alloprevotella sp.]|nr:aldose 1-epimerase family protein [Alloprevotella sp.]
METLQNEYLRVRISNHGAELQSVMNAKGHEYIWQGDPAYWAGRSPLLFPFVGGCLDDEYRVGGKLFKGMPRHGFARMMDFTLQKQTEKSVTYELTSTPQTLELYPYAFRLRVRYRLKDCELQVRWRVLNPGSQTMYVSIGGHPAFNLPDLAAGEPMHGTLRLTPRADRDAQATYRTRLVTPGGNIDDDYADVPTTGGCDVAFTEETFRNDALIFDRCQTEAITLLRADGQPYVRVHSLAPAVGVWSPYGKNAPFVCIEPWWGIGDRETFHGELPARELINVLAPGATLQAGYEIHFS